MKKFQILTLNEKNITDFAGARNRLLNSAKAEWVFFLDSDEKMSHELSQEISDLNTSGYSGFIIKRKIIFLGREIGEDKVLRLAKRDGGKWVRKVHETWHIKGKVGVLKNYIIHNTTENLHEYIEKINKYSSIHASENMRESKHSGLCKIIFFPKFKFVQNIFEGRGFVFSMLQSFHSFLAWSKQWKLQKN